MNVLITGGAGYIGSELVQFMLDEGHKVTVLDNLEYGADSLLRYVGDNNFNFEKLDVRRTELIKPYLDKADAIIPLACLVGFPLCEKRPTDAKQVNYEVNKWIANNKSPDRMLVYPYTNSGYGVSDGGNVCTEESPLNPISLYGETKVEAEKVIMQRSNSVSFRLATVFGVSDRMRIFTGYACELVSSSRINKLNALECGESSAVGRAMAFLGIGIDGSIASADEVQNAVHQEEAHNVTEQQKDKYQELLKHKCFEGKKKKTNEWWTQIYDSPNPKIAADKALKTMQQAIELFKNPKIEKQEEK